MRRSLRSLARRPSAVEVAASAIGVPTFRASSQRLSAELARARRYERQLSVLVLGPDTSADTLGNGGFDAGPLHPGVTAFVLLGSLLRDATRETDVLTQLGEENLFVIVLPEDGTTGAAALAARIAAGFTHRTSLRVVAGAAEFPGDGFTVEDLLARANARLEMCGAEPVSLEAAASDA